jgi:transposase-like protein
MGKARPLARLERIERIEEETTQILALFREVDNTEVVAARLDIKASRVRTRLREAGISTVMLRIERTAAVYRELRSVGASAEQLGVCRATVRARLESAVVLGLLDEFRDEQPRDCVASSHAVTPGASPRGHRLDPAVEAETIRLYEQHHSLRKVGATLGITQEAVRLRLRNAGVDCRRRELLTQDERERAVALYGELRAVSRVAKAMERSPGAVRMALDRAGVVVRPGAWWEIGADARKHRKVGEATIVKRLYDRLGSQTAVAQSLGVSQQLVCRRLALLGASPGRGRRPATRPPSSETYMRLAAIYEAGASARQAAASVGVAHHTALRWLRLAGFDTSRRALLRRREAA